MKYLYSIFKRPKTDDPMLPEWAQRENEKEVFRAYQCKDCGKVNRSDVICECGHKEFYEVDVFEDMTLVSEWMEETDGR